MVRGSNPFGGEIFRIHPDRPWGPPSLLHNGYRVFHGGKAAGAWHWPPTSIACWGWRKSRAIHLLPLWAFMACYRVNVTLPLHITSEGRYTTYRLCGSMQLYLLMLKLIHMSTKCMLIPRATVDVKHFYCSSLYLCAISIHSGPKQMSFCAL
jgi:hypothetical protein